MIKLTCRRIHGTTIANDETVSVKTFAKLEKGVFNLEHRFQQILLKLECCEKSTFSIEINTLSIALESYLNKTSMYCLHTFAPTL